MAKDKKIPGPTSERVRANIKELRSDTARLSLRELSERLTRLGYNLSTSTLGKIEVGDRRVDVDDLVAIALALKVSPNRILGTPSVVGDGVKLIAEGPTNTDRDVWRWLCGESPLPQDGPLDSAGAVQFIRQNRPHEPTDNRDALDYTTAEHAAMSKAVASVEAAIDAGVRFNDLLGRIRLNHMMTELRRQASEGES